MKHWATLKRTVKQALRVTKDLRTGNYFRFSRKRAGIPPLDHTLLLRQRIMPSETFDHKIFNLSTAGEKISAYTIMPREIFSFWQIIGNPDHTYKKGRIIKNGRVAEEAGGGLCQISGIIHHISLIAGLEIVERYNHSVDIYTAETRFAPLGTDATVVYGYKDLRVSNNYPFPIKFEIQVIDHTLEIQLRSAQKTAENTLDFRLNTDSNLKKVTVLNAAQQVISESVYGSMG